jgi:hypothetical protein
MDSNSSDTHERFFVIDGPGQDGDDLPSVEHFPIFDHPDAGDSVEAPIA